MEQNIDNNKVNLESGHLFNFFKICDPLAVNFFLFFTIIHLLVNSLELITLTSDFSLIKIQR